MRKNKGENGKKASEARGVAELPTKYRESLISKNYNRYNNVPCSLTETLMPYLLIYTSTSLSWTYIASVSNSIYKVIYIINGQSAVIKVC